jgi:hypothetical protein
MATCAGVFRTRPPVFAAVRAQNSKQMGIEAPLAEPPLVLPAERRGVLVAYPQTGIDLEVLNAAVEGQILGRSRCPRPTLTRVWLLGREASDDPVVLDVKRAEGRPPPDGAGTDQRVQQPEAVGQMEGGEVGEGADAVHCR